MKNFKFFGPMQDVLIVFSLFILFSSLFLLFQLVSLKVAAEVSHDEYVLAVGTAAQIRTVYVFDLGAVYGYKYGQAQCLPIINHLLEKENKLEEALKHSKKHKHGK